MEMKEIHHNFEREKVLITGGLGFIGSNLAHSLIVVGSIVKGGLRVRAPDQHDASAINFPLISQKSQKNYPPSQ